MDLLDQLCGAGASYVLANSVNQIPPIILEVGVFGSIVYVWLRELPLELYLLPSNALQGTSAAPIFMPYVAQ